MQVKYVEGQTSYRCYGVEVRKGVCQLRCRHHLTKLRALSRQKPLCRYSFEELLMPEEVSEKHGSKYEDYCSEKKISSSMQRVNITAEEVFFSIPTIVVHHLPTYMWNRLWSRHPIESLNEQSTQSSRAGAADPM
ncbi:hypothetical protein TNCV_1903471 [Trichonephila clavipes]|nr:hypothetical protein TNCV_1903471 [Trichonephila clavipes]